MRKPWTRCYHRFFYTTLIALLVVIFLQPILMASCMPIANTKSEVPQTRFSTHWTNVAVGGGGYVTGIYLHPQEPNLVYIRTDIGGFYRWNPKNESWLALTDRFPLSESNYYGGEALAVDPNNPNLVYIAAGLYVSRGPGALFKSTDRGTTWMRSNLKVPMGSNEDKRWAGNRLAVSPFDSNLLLFGSRQNGLWRSTDGGMNWTQVTTLLATPDPEIGILAIAFDPQVPEQVYISAYKDGIYQSKDAGSTWHKIKGSPPQAMKLAVAQDSTLYVTSATAPGVSKYTKGVWQDITPRGEANSAFNGLSVHPRNPKRMLVSLDQKEGKEGAEVYYSSDGGTTWIEKQAKINNTVPWLPNEFFNNATSAIQFDPQIPSRAWLTDWFGIWRTDEIHSNFPAWTNYEKGHEEVVTFTLVSPPEGAVLLSGVADVEGFYHNRLDMYPTRRFGHRKLLYYLNDYFQDTYSIAYCADKPHYMARIGGKRGKSIYGGATSTDGGLSWKPFPNFPASTMPQRVAVSANNPEKFVVTVSGGQPLQTSDGGASWRRVLGLPNGLQGPWIWSQPLVADEVNGNQFYYYADGTVYRSNDSGLSFQPVNTALPREKKWHSLKTMPGIEGDVWLSLDTQGLYHSKDDGKTFSKIPHVEQARLLSLGKPPQGSNIPGLYLYGTIVGQGEGFFLSLNQGKSWINISEPQTPIGAEPNVLEASKQKFGLVFVGTTGRGIYYKLVGQEPRILRN